MYERVFFLHSRRRTEGELERKYEDVWRDALLCRAQHGGEIKAT